MNARRILAYMRKEWIEILRDPITLGVALFMPLVLLFMFGYAITLDVDDIRLAVLDHDKSAESRALVDRFVQSGYFRLEEIVHTDAALEDALQRDRARAALIIPPRFAQSSRESQAPNVQVLIDGTYAATSAVAAAYAGAILLNYPKPPDMVVRPEIRVWYNPGLKSANYIVPGLFAVILMAFPPMLTALAVTREKELGTIQQIYASPLTRSEFLLGKLLPYAVIAYLELLMIMAFGFIWFGVPNHGSLILLLAMGVLYVFCTVSLGLLVSVVTRSQLIAMLLALILSLMPSFLFSGFLFPIFTMPAAFRVYANAFPATYFMEISRGIVLRGAGLAELLPNVGYLLLYTTAIAAIAVWRLKKKVA